MSSDTLRKIWKRFALRGARYASNHAMLKALYMLHDPWSMASPRERYRFAETNQLILRNFGEVNTLLEIGCGEGHQSLYLRQLCNRLIGLDVSDIAVKRARRRCPGSEFLVGDIFCQEIRVQAPFDLVVGCEVLYYMADVPAALRQMQALGLYNFVTYFAGEMEKLDLQVLSLPGSASDFIEIENSRWRAAWWQSERFKG
jgi:SAM-dependent methyltransferase